MSFITVKLADIKDNPYRDPEVYKYDQAKIAMLKESVIDTSYWENNLARRTKDGDIETAYGHHRLQALRELLAEGHTEFEEIKINVRPESQLSNERMLKIFVQENRDDWGESPSNMCMSILQLQVHLEKLLKASKDKEDFLKKVGDVGNLKVDDRSFTRMQNNGVGASTIAQFLGDTWSRQTIQDALQVLENDEATFKLAQKLSSVTLANRFQKLVTKSVDGKGKNKTVTMQDEKTQQKIADKIIKNNLTRSEVEKAIKISAANPDGVDPVGAVNMVVEKKRADFKAKKEAESELKPAPKEPLEKVQIALERVLEITRKERVNLTDEDVAIIKDGLSLIVEVLNEVPEIADPLEPAPPIVD